MKQLEQDELRKIGQRLYECRRKMGWSQSYVAEKIDVSVNTVSAIENGAQQFMSIPASVSHLSGHRKPLFRF